MNDYKLESDCGCILWELGLIVSHNTTWNVLYSPNADVALNVPVQRVVLTLCSLYKCNVLMCSFGLNIDHPYVVCRATGCRNNGCRNCGMYTVSQGPPLPTCVKQRSCRWTAAIMSSRWQWKYNGVSYTYELLIVFLDLVWQVCRAQDEHTRAPHGAFQHKTHDKNCCLHRRLKKDLRGRYERNHWRTTSWSQTDSRDTTLGGRGRRYESGYQVK